MHRFEIHYSDSAEADLLAIGEAIERDAGTAVAERFLSRLAATVMTLGVRPHRQRLRKELGGSIRALHFRSYLIFYTIADGSVIIVRVLHGRQNITAELFSLGT
jgi:toxin ParE1/3/4